MPAAFMPEPVIAGSVIRIKNIWCGTRDTVILKNISGTLAPGEIWAVTGPNGSGKSALGMLLAGRLQPVKGEITGHPRHVGHFSFEAHRSAIEREIREDNTDFLDRIDPGRTALDFICEETNHEARARHYAGMLRIEPVLKKGLKFLSTGEIRKTLICRALIDSPQLLIMDDPFSGLDRETARIFTRLLDDLAQDGITPFLILERRAHMPLCVTHVIRMQHRTITFAGSRRAFEEYMDSATTRVRPATLPDACFPVKRNKTEPIGPILVEMKDVHVDYEGMPVIDGIDWTVAAGESWMITGPNGSGKSTLLSMINGDNPKAYLNDITLFGRRRGTGESIWDIKKNIGYVSTEFQIAYRVSATPLAVILSGLTDSIGIYREFSKTEIHAGNAWLDVLQLTPKKNHAFRSLSPGEQRLVLIARAMIKKPPLLILDEPCQGLSDENSRFVLDLANRIGWSGTTTLLYVTHLENDRLACIRKHLTLIPGPAGSTGCIRNTGDGQ